MWYSSKALRKHGVDAMNKKNSMDENLNGSSFGIDISSGRIKFKKKMSSKKKASYIVFFTLLLVTASIAAPVFYDKNVKPSSDMFEYYRKEKLRNSNQQKKQETIEFSVAQKSKKNSSIDDGSLAKYSISLVLLHVEDWRSFWSSKNLRGFMSFYHENFPDKKEFEGNKRRIFKKEKFIQINISDVESSAKLENIVVRFTQEYKSKSFSDTAKKELVWAYTGDGWKIIAENIIK